MLRSALILCPFAAFCIDLESFLFRYASIWRRLAALCINLVSFCCALHRFKAQSLENELIIYIESRKKGKKVYGEIHLYKERFFHLDANLRFAEETNQVKEDYQIPVIDNFQNLYDKSQEQERQKSKNNYWVETIFNTVQVNIQNIVNFMNEYQPISEEELIPVKDFYYQDLYEIDKEIKLETDTLNFIDHPYFSVLARVKEL